MAVAASTPFQMFPMADTFALALLKSRYRVPLPRVRVLLPAVVALPRSTVPPVIITVGVFPVAPVAPLIVVLWAVRLPEVIKIAELFPERLIAPPFNVVVPPFRINPLLSVPDDIRAPLWIVVVPDTIPVVIVVVPLFTINEPSVPPVWFRLTDVMVFPVMVPPEILADPPVADRDLITPSLIVSKPLDDTSPSELLA